MKGGIFLVFLLQFQRSHHLQREETQGRHSKGKELLAFSFTDFTGQKHAACSFCETETVFLLGSQSL